MFTQTMECSDVCTKSLAYIPGALVYESLEDLVYENRKSTELLRDLTRVLRKILSSEILKEYNKPFWLVGWLSKLSRS